LAVFVYLKSLDKDPLDFFLCQEKREQHIAQIESVARRSFHALTYPSICL